MKNIIYIFIFVLIYSCSSSTKAIDYSKAPEWVRNHPISQSHYLGVGVSKKQRGIDYRKQAQSNAYEEISSEISVSISSNSILKQQDNNGKFKEMFTAFSKTYTRNELKGCKKVSHWENKDEYWAYYKLSKAEVEKHKQTAIEDALISLEQAIIYDDKNEYTNAISSYSMAISVIKPYLGQRLKAKYKGVTVFLGQFIIDKFRNLISSINLEHNQSELKFINFQLIPEIEISLTRNGKKIRNVPLKVTSNVFKYKGNFRFDSNGKVTLPKVRANTFKFSIRTTLSVDIDEMIDETVSDDLVKELLKSYKTSFLELKYILDVDDIGEPVKKTKNNVTKNKIYTNSKINSGLKRTRVSLKTQEANKVIDASSVFTDDGLNKKTGKAVLKNNNKCLLANSTDEHLLIKSIKEESFEDDKLAVAKMGLANKNKCFTTRTIKRILLLFSFEETKLVFLKYAYSFTSDKNNYYTLTSSLTFSSSKKELTTFINNH
ncbi:MAG: DUF4476 domain-containing protein [Flavobacteriaceae bacterium]|nr:DUF4476 domain-containing protein [Flavobacteriaceae bacterium]